MGGDLRGRRQPASGASASHVTTPPVSIVVPTRNGAATLPALLDAIARQRIDVRSKSSPSIRDRPTALSSCCGPPAPRVITIPAGDVQPRADAQSRHRARRRRAGRAARAGRGAGIGHLAGGADAPLAVDSCLAGTFARQLPRPDASAITRHYLARWLRRLPARERSPRPAPSSRRSTPLERLDRCTFDNVCSCIRRSVWEQHPFRATPIGEDVEWARDVLLAGYRLAYVPDARSSTRTIAPLRTNSRGPASCIAGCTSCSASGRFRRPPTSRVRSARASSLHARCERKRPRDRAGVRVAARPVPRRALGGQGPDGARRRGSA